jgi:hypothetical protein
MKMSKNYTIDIPLDEKELQQILYEGKSFGWTFPAEEDEIQSGLGYVDINVTLYRDDTANEEI